MSGQHVIGLIGGIASGKSTVSGLFLVNCVGSMRLEADKIGHSVLNDIAVKKAVMMRWGDCVFDTKGNIDRTKAAKIVFHPSERGKEERHFLQELTHPLIYQRIAEKIYRFQKKETALVILDAPLLLETNFEPLVDKIVFIDCPREKRLARISKRGWTEEHFDAREKAQLPLETKRQRADFIIDNSGTLRDTSQEIKRFLNEIFR